MLRSAMSVCIVCLITVSASAQAEKKIALTFIARYEAGVTQSVRSRAEISAYDPATKRLFSTNGDLFRIDVLDIANPAAPSLLFSIPLSGLPNSLVMREGVLAVAVENAIKTDPGRVEFYNANGGFLNSVNVGALPDMLTFTPNGTSVLVANEGEPNSYIVAGSVDPEGSVSIIDMTGGVNNLTQANVRTATFNTSIPMQNSSSIRVYGPGATLAKDLEPEYITVSHDSKTAWVTLQENNAIGVLDIGAGVFTQLIGLGLKDHSLTSNKLDPSDQDGGIQIANWPVFGMYEPDGIDSYRVGPVTYLVMANEGDTRDYPGFNEERRVGAGNYVLDPATFPNAGTLKLNANLGRLTVTTQGGDIDGDGDFDRIQVPGARSFSIRTTSGELVFDSGDAFEQITKQAVPASFNSNGTAATFDTRSDNKGPEPEGVILGKAFGRTYAFIGLERTGGIIVYDVSDPRAPSFIQYINTSPNDISPEGVLFIKEDDSPNGKPLLVTSNEISGTTAIFQIDKLK